MRKTEVYIYADLINIICVKFFLKCIFQAYTVLGQFLVLKKNEEYFMDWIQDATRANKKQATDCYNCLKEWSDAFL